MGIFFGNAKGLFCVAFFYEKGKPGNTIAKSVMEKHGNEKI